MQKIPVSLAIITLNEEANIGRCIESCLWASEVIVLDSGSTDKTQEIAKKMGASVYVEKFRGFREQKKRATEFAKNDWVLSLDADEVLSPELSKEIYNLYAQIGFTMDGYKFPRKSYHFGRWIYHGGWYPDYQLRLFNQKKANWVGGHVHEHVETDKVGLMTNELLHYVFRDLSDQVDTNNRYSSYGALDLYEKGQKFSLIKLITKPISKFFETYIAKMGFLDGLAGFIISIGASYSIFLKYAKLKELQNKGAK